MVIACKDQLAGRCVEQAQRGQGNDLFLGLVILTLHHIVGCTERTQRRLNVSRTERAMPVHDDLVPGECIILGMGRRPSGKQGRGQGKCHKVFHGHGLAPSRHK